MWMNSFVTLLHCLRTQSSNMYQRQRNVTEIATWLAKYCVSCASGLSQTCCARTSFKADISRVYAVAIFAKSTETKQQQGTKR
eukprot:m.112928 g.112928  ORF g.112928 m.112928 type:complete len:83 (+) comp15344_c1_seq1:1227-1475(+)